MHISRIRGLPKAGIPGVQVNYSPGRAYVYAEGVKIDTWSIVDHFKITRAVEQRSPNLLRWSVMTNTSRKSLTLASQRNRLRRQWTGALVNALRSHGMHADGSPLEGGETRLAGTLELVIHDATNWGATPEKFAEDAKGIIAAVLKHCSRPTNRDFLARSYGEPSNRADKNQAK